MTQFTIKAHEIQKQLGLSKTKHTSILKRLEDGVEKKKVKNLWMINEVGREKYANIASGKRNVEEVSKFVGELMLGAGEVLEGVVSTQTQVNDLPNPDEITDLVYLCDDSFYFNTISASKILDITNAAREKAVGRLPSNKKRHFTCAELIEMEYPSPSNNGCIMTTESGFYDFIFSTNSPKAKPFRNLVCDVILPNLRKRGTYQIGDEALKRESADELDYAIKILDSRLTASRAEFEKVMPKEDNYKILNYLLTSIDHTKESCAIMGDMYRSILDRDRTIDTERSVNASFGDIRIKIDSVLKQHGAKLDGQFLPKGKSPQAEFYRTLFRVADLLSNRLMFKKTIIKKDSKMTKTQAYYEAGFGKQLYEAVEMIADRLRKDGMLWG